MVMVKGEHISGRSKIYFFWALAICPVNTRRVNNEMYIQKFAIDVKSLVNLTWIFRLKPEEGKLSDKLILCVNYSFLLVGSDRCSYCCPCRAWHRTKAFISSTSSAGRLSRLRPGLRISISSWIASPPGAAPAGT